MKYVIDKAIWEHEEYVITIRLESESKWKGRPIGGTLSKKEADIVIDWLSSAIIELDELL